MSSVTASEMYATESQPNNNIQLQNKEKLKTKSIVSKKSTVKTSAIPYFKNVPYKGPVIHENESCQFKSIC
ncbi:hypothetical protein [Macrococcus armenti]|uniref:hypothetical protein n=1 Tax=Macrococcus armenti TaxID=2875764 RepID=UPI001CD43FC3|nr:hypothetical protein [Macrococcus armenti]UBH11401.1 hypothetical protein LAU38_02730 [Macrococcus armenti]